MVEGWGLTTGFKDYLLSAVLKCRGDLNSGQLWYSVSVCQTVGVRMMSRNGVHSVPLSRHWSKTCLQMQKLVKLDPCAQFLNGKSHLT